MLDDLFNDSKLRVADKTLGSLGGRGRSPDQKTPLFRWSKTTRTGDTTELTIGPSFGLMIVIVVSLLIGTSTPLGRILEFLMKFLFR